MKILTLREEPKITQLKDDNTVTKTEKRTNGLSDGESLSYGIPDHCEGMSFKVSLF